MIVRARPTHALPYLLAFVLGVGAAALTACGSTNKAMIPAQNASNLKSHLDEVLNAVDSHDCTRSGRAIDQVRADLDSLPAGTSQRLEQRLREGVTKLSDQASKECVKTTPTQTAATTQTQTVQTQTIPTVTTDTTATVPTTPTTTTPTTTPTTTTPTTATSPVPPDYTPATTPTVTVVKTVPTETEPGKDLSGAGGSKNNGSGTGGGGNAGGGDAGVGAAGAGAGGALPGSLASTGSDPLVPIGIGLSLLALSGLAFARQRRQD